MKKYIIAFFVLLLTAQVVFCAYGTKTYLADDAQLLNAQEAAKMEELLSAASEKWNVDIVVHTTDSLYGKSAMHYTDDYYDYHGYSDDGVILMVSMTERQWWISTAGKCIDIINADSMGKRFTAELSTGYYYDAFTAFLDGCEIAMDSGYYPSASAEPQSAIPLLVCVVFGIVVGLIVVLIMKGQLKTVRSQPCADNYVRQGSLQLRQCTDMFLYQNTTRRPKPQNNNRSGGHIGSSGRSHGGGGGRF